MSEKFIYKICKRSEWAEAEKTGVYKGSSVDIKDGFIHFSTAEQLAGTVAKHFKGQSDLVLVEVMAEGLDLVWEASRGGNLFPHLYGDLSLQFIKRVSQINTDSQGQHHFDGANLEVIED